MERSMLGVSLRDQIGRSADELRSPTLHGELLDVSGSGRDTLLADETSDGAKDFWCSDSIVASVH